MKKRILKKSVFVIGEGPTEKLYFEHLKKTKKFNLKVAPSLPEHSDYESILKKAERKVIEDGYDYAICLFDMDTIIEDGHIDSWLKKCKNVKGNIIPICSNPCTEIWFLQHFLQKYSGRIYESYDQVVSVLKKYYAQYDKTEKFFTTTNFFDKLDTGESIAISNSCQQLKHVTVDSYKNTSFSEIPVALELLEKCKQCNFDKSCTKCIKDFKKELLVTKLLHK